MSLDANWSKCGEAWSELLPGLRQSIIYATMAVELGKVTEQNIQEWQFRLACLTVTGEHTLVENKGNKLTYRQPTEAELRASIGLATNVPTSSRAAFMRKVARVVERKAQRLVDGR